MQASESPGAPPDSGGEDHPVRQARLLYIGAGAGSALVLAGALFLIRPAPKEPVQVFLVPEAALASAEINVYVSGAVRAPGVYRLAGSDRAQTAVEAAGGPSDGADMDKVNLAARLKDGDHVHVPKAGEPAAAVGRRLSLNTASEKDLDALPGIGTVRARNIMGSREKDGPFRDSFDLVTRKLVPLSVYQQIKDLVGVQ